MEIKIGIQFAPRELVVETNETPEAVQERVAAALTDGGLLSLVDSKGRTVLVPGEKIAYLELGSPHTGTVGFR